MSLTVKTHKALLKGSVCVQTSRIIMPNHCYLASQCNVWGFVWGGILQLSLSVTIKVNLTQIITTFLFVLKILNLSNTFLASCEENDCNSYYFLIYVYQCFDKMGLGFFQPLTDNYLYQINVFSF